MQFKTALLQSLKNLKSMFPIMIGMLLFISLLNNLLKDVYQDIFTGNIIYDSFI